MTSVFKFFRKLVRWMCNVISGEELRSRLKLKSVTERSRERNLQRFGFLEEVLDLVHVASLRFSAVSTKDNLGKHGMR